MTYSSELGKVGWIDLTVKDAEAISAFYTAVIGWRRQAHPMGDYVDFNMSAENEPIVGICHALKENANLPPQWLVYINVASVQASVEQCVRLGGKVLDGPRMMGDGQFCVIQDPAGAVMALMSQPA